MIGFKTTNMFLKYNIGVVSYPNYEIKQSTEYIAVELGEVEVPIHVLIC
jgi:hypothetical protein